MTFVLHERTRSALVKVITFTTVSTVDRDCVAVRVVLVKFVTSIGTSKPAAPVSRRDKGIVLWSAKVPISLPRQEEVGFGAQAPDHPFPRVFLHLMRTSLRKLEGALRERIQMI